MHRVTTVLRTRAVLSYSGSCSSFWNAVVRVLWLWRWVLQCGHGVAMAPGPGWPWGVGEVVALVLDQHNKTSFLKEWIQKCFLLQEFCLTNGWIPQRQKLPVPSTQQAIGDHGGTHCINDTDGFHPYSLLLAFSRHLKYANLPNNTFCAVILHFLLQDLHWNLELF